MESSFDFEFYGEFFKLSHDWHQLDAELMFGKNGDNVDAWQWPHLEDAQITQLQDAVIEGLDLFSVVS